MTATITTERTLDELANADKRSIRTRWTTSITKADKYDGESTIILVLETSHSKRSKRIETDLYVEELNERGFSIRSFTLYDRDPSAGFGITVTRTPVARFNAKAAREQHAEALELLESTPITRPGRAGTDLAAAWAARI